MLRKHCFTIGCLDLFTTVKDVKAAFEATRMSTRAGTVNIQITSAIFKP